MYSWKKKQIEEHRTEEQAKPDQNHLKYSWTKMQEAKLKRY